MLHRPGPSHLPSPSELTIQNPPKLIPAGRKETGKVLCVPLESNSKNACHLPPTHTHNLDVETHTQITALFPKRLVPAAPRSTARTPSGQPSGCLPLPGPGPRAGPGVSKARRTNSAPHLEARPPHTDSYLNLQSKAQLPFSSSGKGGSITKNKTDELAAASATINQSWADADQFQLVVNMLSKASDTALDSYFFIKDQSLILFTNAVI